MAGKVVKGALCGGLVLWLWSFVYWAVSGIPIKGLTEFKDEGAVERVLKENAPTPGYYVIPTAYTPKGLDPGTFAEARMKKISSEFFFAGSVHVGGLGSLGGQMLRSIAGNLVSAGIATLLLLQTAGLGFRGRVLFVEGLALISWTVAAWPMSVWWGMPCGFVLLQLLDFLVGWGLAGMVLARVVGDSGGPGGPTP